MHLSTRGVLCVCVCVCVCLCVYVCNAPKHKRCPPLHAVARGVLMLSKPLLDVRAATVRLT